ncbi:hypothetical protein ASPFODRAFT_46672 [Aspergillus luchuensis CBS 106.47]|uniref:Uncharacterized protein n=1 Tax=Aspergillus luchuensis (strain CBS 106.47) TaxID=1137211 RepID=A0A1M3TFU8_ASPLC|nr:hypothetical protein ASPFODRAFT_46672 [Aspergillus luchuensis CBS 106.47]
MARSLTIPHAFKSNIPRKKGPVTAYLALPYTLYLPTYLASHFDIKKKHYKIPKLNTMGEICP